ncbi:ester cyclase [Cohnella nanjingensis]|uniref:Ester cyclase n=1 Tax=Cohnella nanjingensis TaxID=1387779 RepID=A0A7X0RR71_9BACL|nr:ester cyclase [Cohnella nanjingensis]MBB6672194.1 ester cyclase [Cohnella nanjingensis]
MTNTEQKNAETVIAFIEELRQRGELEHTDQFFAPQIGEAFSDRQFAVDEIFAQGDKVIARILITGTHTGMFAGHAPTGQSAKITQFREFRLADGRIAEQRAWVDTGTLLPQIQARK